MYNYSHTYDTFVTYMTQSSYYGDHQSNAQKDRVDYTLPVMSQSRYYNRKMTDLGDSNIQLALPFKENDSSEITKVKTIRLNVTTHDVLAAMSRNPYIRVDDLIFYGKFHDLIAE